MQMLSLPAMTTADVCPTGGVWVLGFFDGVHAGHQKLLSAAGDLAREKSGCPVGVWTFASLPKAEELLTDPAERALLLCGYGVRYLAVEEFSAVSHLSGEAFWQEILMGQFAPAAVVCGYNFRFGYRGESTAEDLARWGRQDGVQVHIVSPYLMDERPVSSTWIRSLIREGEVDKAKRLLTRPYCIAGVVEHGKALGRKLGFPTANLRLPPCKAAPARGIYACLAGFTDTDGVYRELPGVCNIGSRPTVNGDASDVTVETWILDYSGDLYGRELKISFFQKIRDEKTFDSLEALTAQVKRDAETVRAYFAL